MEREHNVTHIPLDQLEGSLLVNRYAIRRLLGSGSHGMVHKLTDILNPMRPLVIKLSKDVENFAQEIKVMRRVSNTAHIHDCPHSTPEVVDYGMIIDEEQLMAWVIMPRFGMSIETYFTLVNNKMSRASVLYLGDALLSMLEQTHEAGYV
jgi:serine/threonine protein kinase